jgi:hypothetical protein
MLDENDVAINPSARNRPVLLWAHNGVITQREAERLLGFMYIELYSSLLKKNCEYDVWASSRAVRR